MKKLIFIALLFVGFYSQAQTNRFPSIDSAKNYVLRYIRNSTVESFTNLRMQTVTYGTLELLDSITSASSGGGVDSIWRSQSATKDTLKYSISGTTYTICTLDRVDLKLNISDTANIRPRLYAGSNITITGTYPNLTLASSGSGGSSDTSLWSITGTNLFPKGHRYIALGDSNTTAAVPLDFQGGQKWYQYLTPDNYGTAYTSSVGGDYATRQGRAGRFMMGYGRFNNVNPGPDGGRPNIVGVPWGYNATVEGGRIDTAEAGFQFRTETHYINNGTSTTPAWFEFHLPEITPKNGSAYRLWSFYSDKVNGNTLIQSHNDRMDLYNRETPDSNYIVLQENGIAQYTWTSGNQISNTMTDAINGRTFTTTFEDGNLIFSPPTSRNIVFSGTGSSTFNSLIGNNNFYNKVGLPDEGMVIGQTSVFANTEARLQIYGKDGGSQIFQLRTNPSLASSDKILQVNNGGETFLGIKGLNGNQSRVSIGNLYNDLTTTSSAALEVRSTTMGFLLPRMTKTQRDAISSPVAGLMIYQTDNTPGLRVYNGTNWMKFTEATD